MIPLEQVKERALQLLDAVAEAALRAGRAPEEVALLAATKNNDAAHVRAAIDAGVTLCGENRVQELTDKLAQDAYAGAQVHFIGHLQKNKAKQVVGRVDLIQSVDSRELAALLNRLAGERGLRQRILLEINIGGEQSKSGIAPEAAMDFAAEMVEYPNLELCGLMAIPPVSENNGSNRRFFAKMYALSVDISAKKYDNVAMNCLSMGMSHDYADAIAEGATLVRVGSAIFGSRA